jgi:hypothetical protein
MLRLLVGLALLPLSAALSWSAVRTLAGVALSAPASGPFTAGLGLALAAWLVGRAAVFDPIGPLGWAARAARWGYVLGHELTHALAAWAQGGSVFAIKVAPDSGHVDLTGSNAFTALAPYCVPFYTALVALGYRALLWARPDAGGQAVFLLLMGLSLGAHFLFTWDALTRVKQPDLDAAGGTVFSLALIGAVNATLVMLLLKGLFPAAVPLGERFGDSTRLAARAWRAAWSLAAPAAAGLRPGGAS